MIKNFLDLLLEYKDQIQVISSILSVIIIFFTAIFTLIYVKLTSGLVNVPYKSFLRPKKIEWKNSFKEFFITIMNYGPGLPSWIRVSTFASVEMRRESEKSDIRFFKEMLVAEGPDEIQMNEEKAYKINGIFIDNCYVVIEYRSLTGKQE